MKQRLFGSSEAEDVGAKTVRRAPFLLQLALGLVALGTVQFALAQDLTWKAVETAAQKEGRVLLYSQLDPTLQLRLEAGFAKEHPGIKLEVVRISGAAVIARIEQECSAHADGADVVITTVMQWLEKNAKDGVLKAPIGPASKVWPEKYLLGEGAPVLSVEPIVMAYNTNLVKTPITSYQDLLRTDLKGKIGALIPATAPSVVAWYDFLEKIEGEEFMRAFGAQSPRFYPSSVPATQALASGEIAVAAFTLPVIAGPLIQDGAPIKVAVPKQILGVQYGGGILASSRRPNAAQILMDYLISMQGQIMWSGRGESASPLPNVPGSIDPNSITPYDEAGYTPEVMRRFREHFNQMFQAGR
jgi:iron(III) transport system substrate-binding protein